MSVNYELNRMLHGVLACVQEPTETMSDVGCEPGCSGESIGGSLKFDKAQDLYRLSGLFSG